MTNKPLKVLVKPTHKCNQNCEYCYDRQFGDMGEMSLYTVKDICEFVSLYTKNVQWIWHGGEPSIMPVDFYYKSYEIMQRYGLTEHISMQSNGSLLNKEFIQMLIDTNCSLGLSLDGVTHDLKRNNLDKTLGNIALYEKMAGYTPGVIKVVDKDSADKLVDDYNFFKGHGIKQFQINRIFETPTSKMIDDENISVYLDSYKALLDMWANDPQPIMVRNFQEEIGYILGTGECLCSRKGNCVSEWICFNPRGDMYPCDRYYTDEYKLGNVRDFRDYEHMVDASLNFHKVKNLSDKRKEYCRDIKKCQLYPFCNGGCNGNAITVTGGLEPDPVDCYITQKEIIALYNFLKDVDVNEVKNPVLQRLLMKSGLRNIEFIKTYAGDRI